MASNGLGCRLRFYDAFQAACEKIAMKRGDAHKIGEDRKITWFVSRHPGTIVWAKRKPLAIDRWVGHLNPSEVSAGDTVIGTLPVNLAAKVCKRGAHYLHLSLDVSAEWRGREMTVDELMSIKAELTCFHIEEEK